MIESDLLKHWKERAEKAERALLGQFADVRPGDYVECRSSAIGDHKGIVKDLEPLHRMIRLESGWCLHQKDVLIKHVPADGDDDIHDEGGK